MYAQYKYLCQFGLLSQAYQPISPSILIHFRWEWYHRVRKVQLENGVWAWSFSSSQYLQSAVKNVEEYVGKPENSHLKIPSKAETPLTISYRPELDVSPELAPRDAVYYQSLIGILRWIVELGRIDICQEVSMMS